MSPDATLRTLHSAPAPWVLLSVNGLSYGAAMVLLALAAAWVAAPSRGYALGPSEAELATTSIGPLAVGMQVERLTDDSERRSGVVVKFIRRDAGARAADLAVVRWTDAAQPRESAEPLAVLKADDPASLPRYAQRRR